MRTRVFIEEDCPTLNEINQKKTFILKNSSYHFSICVWRFLKPPLAVQTQPSAIHYFLFVLVGKYFWYPPCRQFVVSNDSRDNIVYSDASMMRLWWENQFTYHQSTIRWQFLVDFKRNFFCLIVVPVFSSSYLTFLKTQPHFPIFLSRIIVGHTSRLISYHF